MKTWPFAVVVLVLLALVGCRTDPTITLLERQNRLMEDEIYRLRGIIQDYDGGGMPSCTVEDSSEIAPAQIELKKTRDSAAAPSESTRPWKKKPASPQAVQPPMVELPSEAQPPGEVPETIKRPAGTKAPNEPGKLNAPETPMHLEGPSGPSLPYRLEPKKGPLSKPAQIRPASAIEPISLADSKDVGQVVLNHMLTGAYNSDGKSGDNGVLVVLEPRDAKGRRLEAPADVSIVVLDPAKSGDAARLARWDFTTDETAKLFRGSGVGQGMYIECPWPDNPPEHNKLHLFVRYTTSDGRKLQADQPIEVALPGESISRWTPSESHWISDQSADSQITSYQPETQTAEYDSTESTASDSFSLRPSRSTRTASRSNGAKLRRPVWSPERF